MLKLKTMILICTLVNGQVDILESKRLESVEMVRDIDIFEAEVAFTGPSSVEVTPGEDATLFCQVEIPYKFCNFISPRDVTYSLGPHDEYVHDGRISFAESDYPNRVCGIQVGQVEDIDNGEWRCKVTVVGEGVVRELSGRANITVVGGDVAREFSGRANITVVGGGVAREFSGKDNVTVDNLLPQAIHDEYKESHGNITLKPIVNVEEESILDAEAEYMDEEGSTQEPFSDHGNARVLNKFSFEGVTSLDGYATVSTAKAHSKISVNMKKIRTEDRKSVDSTESSLGSTSYSTAGLSSKSTSVFISESSFADMTDPSTASTNNMLNTSEEGFSQIKGITVIPITVRDDSDDVNDPKGFKDSNNMDNYKNDSGASDAEDSNDNAYDSYDDDYESNLSKTLFSEGHVVVCVIVVIVVFVIIFITGVARIKGMLCFQNHYTQDDKFSLDFSAIEKGEFTKENEMGDFEYNEEESNRSTLQL